MRIVAADGISNHKNEDCCCRWHYTEWSAEINVLLPIFFLANNVPNYPLCNIPASEK